MPKSRTIIDARNDYLTITYMLTERTFQSSWSQPDVPVLVFADSSLPGFSVQYHGGPVGSGLPVELLFWGDWWTSGEGVARRILIETRVQAVLASDYFSELKQYGIERPHWRGAKIVTRPGAPASINSNDDFQVVPNLIDSLIDDDVFPDPDDEKIAFMVFMPKGFTEGDGAIGGHTHDYNLTLPIDKDWYWVAYASSFGDTPGSNPEDVIGIFTHELVEMLSDPECDGWFANNDCVKGEIGDAAVKGGASLPQLPGQTAWVNGAHVTAYWSNQYGATVIPIDRDYKARILGTIGVEHRAVEYGIFRPDPSDSRLCDLLPQCCLEMRDYKYTIVKRDEIVQLSVETERYRQPLIVWAVEGIPVTGNGMLSLPVIAGTFNGHHAKYESKTVSVQCTLLNNELTLRTVGTECNFGITVSCTVTDGSITGNVRTNVIAKPSLSVGFVGVELTVDPAYNRQRAACEKAATKMFKDLGKTQPRHKIKIGDPVVFDPGILSELPAYTRLHQFERARRVVDIASMAYAVLPAETAKSLTASLVSDVPALQVALAIRAETQRSKS